jgi:ribonuclease P protein component
MSEKEPNNLLAPLSTDVHKHQLPKLSILRGKSAFEQLFKATTTFRSGSILFRYCQVPVIEHTSIPKKNLQTAFIAPKRLGDAVLRNKAKRLFRESFRTSNAELHHFLEKNSIYLHLALIARYPSPNFEHLKSHMRKGLNNLIENLAHDIDTFQCSEEYKDMQHSPKSRM